ncbi:hypothetical protein Mapa_012035 [Marchantia paleacea]|nr:hypothetical protein Mapa_012035 [Marchantia paleacea]
MRRTSLPGEFPLKCDDGRRLTECSQTEHRLRFSVVFPSFWTNNVGYSAQKRSNLGVEQKQQVDAFDRGSSVAET